MHNVNIKLYNARNSMRFFYKFLLLFTFLICPLYNTVDAAASKEEPLVCTDQSPKPHNPNDPDAYHSPKPTDFTPGTTTIGADSIAITTAQLMKKQAEFEEDNERIPKLRKPLYRNKNHRNFPQNNESLDLLLSESRENTAAQNTTFRNPQTIGTSFTGPQFSDVFLFPPDSMGAAGPTQYTVCINGRIKTFRKTTGLADGVMDVDTDVFFASVRNSSFTSDPRIRYDRVTGRWFIVMINVPTNFTENRIMLAVSSTSRITPSTVWQLFFFDAGSGVFLDYPTLGIDKNALYIGGTTFSNTNTGNVYVIRKSSVLAAGPIVVTTFSNVINTVTGVGPRTPQGVDNLDASQTFGYFIGPDNATFGRLVLLAITNPGGIPLISGNILLTVPATAEPISVPHLGNTGGTNGNLDGIDDRLMIAHIRNNHLWTVHNIGVDNTGTASPTPSRNGCRWYEIILNGLSTPTINQVGTLFATTPMNDANQRSYWMGSIMSTGQTHMALGCSTAGAMEFANGAAAGRLSTDAANSIQATTPITASSTAYNPPGDSGSSSGRRWGDYSYVAIDPLDDQTMWTIQEFCNATNSWAVQVAKLIAPPPATPVSASPNMIHHGQTSITVSITGNSISGSAFFDSGIGFNSRCKVRITGGVVVNSQTVIDPTHITLNVSTVVATLGSKNVTVTNPDGQSITANGLITVIT